MKPWLRSGDFWSGLALAALGTFIVVKARGWAYMTEEGPGPGFFPLWYGAVMVVLSLALAVRAALRPVAREPVRWRDVSRALACWAAFVACVALMPVLGFAVSFALLATFIVRVMCGQRMRTALLVAVVGAAGFYAIFALALDLSLPKGMLF